MDKKRAAYASQDTRPKTKTNRMSSITDRNKKTYNTNLPQIRDAKSTKAIGNADGARSVISNQRYGLAGYES